MPVEKHRASHVANNKTCDHGGDGPGEELSPHFVEIIPAKAPLDEDGRVGFSSYQNVPQPA